MTDRRTFIGAVTLGVLTAPLGAQVQRVQKMYRIGWLAGTAPPMSTGRCSLRECESEAGSRGKTSPSSACTRTARASAFPHSPLSWCGASVDIIVTGERRRRQPLATPPPQSRLCSSTPVIRSASGFVANLARPGGNITGLGGLAPGVSSKTLELLKEAVPKASRIAILVNSSVGVQAASLAEIEPAARRIGVLLSPVEIRAPDELDSAFAAIARERPGCAAHSGPAIHVPHRARVAALALEQRLPAIISFKEVAEAGLLMSYGALLLDDLRRLPHYLDRILKGTPPGELPVEQPSRFYLVVNLKTARAIGIAIPQSLLLRADEVIQ